MADRLDLELLRAAMDYGWKDWHYGDPLHDTDIGALDTILDAARFLLSVLDEGGRLVVEAPCEHGVFHDSCDQLVCGHDHLLTDGWYPDARAECWCPGGSRRQVWPNDKETA